MPQQRALAQRGGLVAPSQTIFTGAAVGRLYGQLLHALKGDVATQPCAPPHAMNSCFASAHRPTPRRRCRYALMGACALLGGIQRATIALVVIMLEGAIAILRMSESIHPAHRSKPTIQPHALRKLLDR